VTDKLHHARPASACEQRAGSRFPCSLAGLLRLVIRACHAAAQFALPTMPWPGRPRRAIAGACKCALRQGLQPR
jgi:hypothetical protein